MSPPTDMAASVKARLLNLRTDKGRPFDHLLSAYVLERLLYRLSESDHKDRFILKGAVLFSVWFDTPHRPTRDLDLMGYGSNSPDSLVQTFGDICRTPVEPDGLVFSANTIEAETIRDGTEHVGGRVTCLAFLGSARCPVQIDVGFGDAITPPPEFITLTTLLGHAAPRLRAYPRETVIAEKVEAMVTLGIANSRSKDLFDVWTMADRMSFEGQRLADALKATLGRRGVRLPDGMPLALTDAFADDTQQRVRWAALVRKLGASEAPEDFAVVIAGLRRFLEEPLGAVGTGNRFSHRWLPGGPWVSAPDKD
ncbi:MAG: nucleotidyl transferase AbiEii/AbiGii toxin family protein [Armatimonadetes bacterium]|nr:nucleotidyl transferase AbiEii/AbiGii toxin family protein [Armatimonadota bacterium]